jgi:hypothetical protein
MPTDADIQEFKQIYEKEFGENISDADARLLAIRVVSLYEALSQPLGSDPQQLVGSEMTSKMDISGSSDPIENGSGALDQRSFINKPKL